MPTTPPVITFSDSICPARWRHRHGHSGRSPDHQVDLGVTASSSNYNFDANVTRNGKISPADLAFAAMNLGASTKISPIISVNLNPADDPLNDRITSDKTVNFTGTVTPCAR